MVLLFYLSCDEFIIIYNLTISYNKKLHKLISYNKLQ